jgi:hypothetical protein
MTHKIDLTKLEAAVEDALAVKSVQLDAVLLICDRLGQILQGIPTKERKLTVARLTNERDKLAEKGDAIGAMMLSVVAHSWNTFKN